MHKAVEMGKVSSLDILFGGSKDSFHYVMRGALNTKECYNSSGIIKNLQFHIPVSVIAEKMFSELLDVDESVADVHRHPSSTMGYTG